MENPIDQDIKELREWLKRPLEIMHAPRLRKLTQSAVDRIDAQAKDLEVILSLPNAANQMPPWCCWDVWVGNDPHGTWMDAVLLIKHLYHDEKRGRRIDLHKFLQADEEGCFHTHPATAVRVVLWGGYVEEVYGPDRAYHDAAQPPRPLERTFKTCRPGHISIIRPEYTHRIHSLLNGKSSYSLWFRGPVTHEIKLIWPGSEQVVRQDVKE